MRLKEVRELFRSLTAEYFGNANVQMARQSRVAKPNLPLVLLTFGHVKRPTRPNITVFDGFVVGQYNSTVQLDIDLFTHGSPVTEDGRTIGAYENTAVEDLCSFEDYLDSEYVVEWCDVHSLSIQREGDVEDLSGIIGETSYEYRARMRLVISYTSLSVEHAGVLSEDSIIYPTGEFEDGEEVFAPGAPVRKTSTTGNFGSPEEDREKRATVYPDFSQTASGGGTQILAHLQTGFFTEAEIEFVPYPGESGQYTSHGFAVKGHLDNSARTMLQYLERLGFHPVTFDFDGGESVVYVTDNDIQVEVDNNGTGITIFKEQKAEQP